MPYMGLLPEKLPSMTSKRDADGTGKTITLLSLITSYQLAHPEVPKLVYCTRTVPEMEKALEELRELIKYRTSILGAEGGKILALGLSSRRNMCIHPEISQESDRIAVDAQCRSITASWVRQRKEQDNNINVCSFFEGFDKHGSQSLLQPGVYTLDDLRNMGKEKGWCPYFTARHMIRYANVIVYNYAYVIDPKISLLVSRDVEKESILVFDEAHNIDNVCIEALSVNINKKNLDGASRNIATLSRAIEKSKEQNAEQLRQEYERLVAGLQGSGAITGAPLSDQFGGDPVGFANELEQLIPGDIIQAHNFISFMRKVVDFLKERLRVSNTVEMTDNVPFVRSLMQKMQLQEPKSLRFSAQRLKSLLHTLEVVDVDTYTPLSLVADFCALVSTYTQGFKIIIEPFDERLPNVPDPILHLACLDASLAIKPVFEHFQSVVITSGTLSPIDLYPKILNFVPLTKTFEMSLSRQCICPMIVTRGSDQMPLNARYQSRSDRSIIHNYGRLIVELSSCVPDGMVVFFPSYRYMEEVVGAWANGKVLEQITTYKLLFIETQDVVETTLALENFKRACDCGRGAVFFSVARGKVAEGIDFDKHYGRAVIIIGIPFQYTLSKILRARLDYMKERYQIDEGDFLTFDAMRQRYARNDKKSKLPSWIRQYTHDTHVNLSTDMAVNAAKEFLAKMAVPQSIESQVREKSCSLHLTS
ncbi:ERCC2/XPD/Rad3 nucleotide excision repair [Guillardia theta CCMP2712]|uniref:DNA 5'-3' helicase n=1 Tax=Guillardia theta (strain CCMP2712) TaxID=905079 RepID=L1ISS5_GUITC|nr:ERCC2/XPD/Rad3 nucleotide excision repair [Guillardia theta CCMP2712]EKX39162.1 ERCC2/XPD/Rad3 nucleotide excision repair [Guillardia theta CCMP2712]|eukprot:XP_005826142.1 ERCC2/XPD/Rad3 nucleotide excision repair [Guillardia theta CCMP2712]